MLHFGSLVAAVGSWLCARHSGGQWLVRIDDVDPPRVVPGAASGILATLAAFGLDADGPVLFQSRRGKAYGVAFERLRASGALFPCWCSRGDLIAAGSIHRDGRCITGKDPARAPAWRLRAPDREVRFHDALQGHPKQNLRERTGDFVVRRADGIYTYQLVCVVDDAFQRISHVVRGYDLLEFTPRQIVLQECLGLPAPDYMHLPVATDADGRKLSKSEQAAPVDASNPMPALRHALAFLGVPAEPQALKPASALSAAISRFDYNAMPRCSNRCVA